MPVRMVIPADSDTPIRADADPTDHPAKPGDNAPSPAHPARTRLAVLVTVIVIVLVGLALALGTGQPTASSSSTEGDTTSATSSDTSENNTESNLSTEQVKSALRNAGLSKAEATKGARLSQSDTRIAQIAGNADAYKKDGTEVQKKLLELAIDDPEAIDFVLDWPDRYPAASGEAYTDKVTKGTIPQLYQWDQRWGYTTYSGATFARTGCAPTALAMVYMGLTGNEDKTPYDMAQLAREDGYESPHDGTVGDFLTDDAEKLGLTCQTLVIDETALRTWLDQGGVIICNVGAGDFTDGGHFFVITGIDKKGKLTIHDPYSSVRSAKHWGINRILNQTIALYGFTAAA